MRASIWQPASGIWLPAWRRGSWELGAGIGQPASGGWRPAWQLAFGSWRMGTGIGQPASGGWGPAFGGWRPAASGRLFDDGAGVVFGVVAEGDLGDMYTLTYW